MLRGRIAALVRDRLRPDDIVVVGLGSTGRGWREAQAPNPTYFASDPMGAAPALALGLAIAKPDRRVVLLEGDGDLAMNLGVLVTIAGSAVTNLRIVVFQNGRYETGGGQSLPSDRLSFGTVARGAGWHRAADAADEAAAVPLLDDLFARDGLGLVAVRVDMEPAPYPTDPGPTSAAEDKVAFQRRIGA